jgi:hypothetical protein
MTGSDPGSYPETQILNGSTKLTAGEKISPSTCEKQNRLQKITFAEPPVFPYKIPFPAPDRRWQRLHWPRFTTVKNSAFKAQKSQTSIVNFLKSL